MFFAQGMLAFSALFLAIAVFLVHYLVRRAAWRRAKRLGKKNLRFHPSAAALARVLLFMQLFHGQSMAQVLETKQDEDAEGGDEGDPESLKEQLERQLKRIRVCDPINRLVLRI